MTRERDLGIRRGQMLNNAERRFQSAIDQSGVPDIDEAQRILPTASKLYTILGVPPEFGRKLAAGLEDNLLAGTASQQINASQTLLSLERACQDITYRKNGRNKS